MGEGVFFFSTGPHSSHKARGRTCRNGGGRWDGRCCIRARCVITEHAEHLADRRKSPVWSTEVTYLPGSTTGVPEGRSAALIYAGARQSGCLNRHKIWPGCENGHVKEAPFAGLDIRNANNGAPPHYRILYLELRQRPVSREHARPQPPAGSSRYGGEANEPAPVPVGVTGHRTQRGQGPSWTPRTTLSPDQLTSGPRWCPVG
jgi:hypothetical protein